MTFKIKDDHWETMLAFMELHKDFAVGRIIGPNGREKTKQLWVELAARLNSLGYGERTPEKWQKTWTDLKYLLKKKGAVCNKEIKATGGGSSESAPFNSNELRIISILGKSFYEGVGEAEIAGTSTTKDSTKVSYRNPVREEVSLPSTSAQVDHDYSYTTKKKRRAETTTEQAYIETIDILKDIRNIIDNRLGQIVSSIADLKGSTSQSANKKHKSAEQS